MLNQSKSNVKEQLISRPRLKPTFNLVTTKEEEIRLKDKRKVCCVCGTLHEIKYVIPLRSEIAVEQKSMICLNILSDTTNIMYPEMTKQNNIEAFVCLRCVVDAKDAYIFRRKCMNSLMKTAEKYRFPFKTFIRSDSKKKFVNASTQTEGYKPHQCGMCDVIYGSYEELKSHMIERHPPTTSQGASEARRTSREKLNTRPNHILLHHENSYQSLNDTVDERKQNEIRDLAIQSVDSDNEMQKSLGTSFEESIIYEEEEFDEINPFHLDETIEFDEHDFENEEQVQQIFIEADEIDYSLIEYEHIPEIFEDDTKYEEPEMTGDISEELDSDKLAKAIESDNNEDAMSEISEKKSSDEELSSIEQLTPKPKTNNKCTLCERMFTRSAHLARHMKCHNNVRDHKCTECDKSFTRPDHLALHMHNHSKTKPFQCDKCNKQFTRAERYRFHLANKLCGTPKPSINYCDICHKSFSSTHYLRIHMDNHTATTFPCKVCDMKLTNRSAYHQHMRTHTKREYLCPECGATFRRADYLSMHLRRHSGVKPFKCRYCDKSFPRNTEMKMHERYHTGEKTQMCTICGKKFHRACNLKVHMRVHTGEKPYQCTHCDRTFSQSNDLKTHIRRHTGERFKCDLCAETFLFSHYLSRHKRDVHNVEVPVVNSRVEKFEVCNSEDECDEEVDEDECKIVLCEGSDDPLDVSNMIAAVDIRNLDVQIEALL